MRKKPSACWYLVCLLAIAGSGALFWGVLARQRTQVTEAVAQFQRFVGPGFGLFEADTPDNPNHGAAVLEFKEPGTYSVCYESFGKYQEYKGDEGQSFDTPARQIWPTKNRVAMTLEVIRHDGADSGAKMVVRQAGLEPDEKEQARIEKNPRTATPKNRGLFVYRREIHGRAGHAVWQVEIPAAGFYRFETRYVDGVDKDPDQIVVPPLFTKEEQAAQKIPAYRVQAREKERREAEEDRALAQVKRLPVLFAVGIDPLGQRMFDPMGIYGAAGLCAVVTTLSLVGMLLVAAMRGRED